jgi:hypothetical protein
MIPLLIKEGLGMIGWATTPLPLLRTAEEGSYFFS